MGLGQLMLCWYMTRTTNSIYHPSLPFSIPHQLTEDQLTLFDSCALDDKEETSTVNRNTLNTNTNKSINNNNYYNGDTYRHIPFFANSNSNVKVNDKLLSYHSVTSFKLNVITRREDGLLEKRAFPYWSWIPCSFCNVVRPPRCHHCPLCRKCILNREHHCFFTGTCIGVRNQGIFILFAFWAVFSTLFGTTHMLMYTYHEIIPIISYVDFVPPIALCRVLLGYTPVFIPFLCFLFWALLLFTGLSIGMLCDILQVTLTGKTSFERANKIKILDSRSVKERWSDVLGENWILKFMCPWKVFNNRREEDMI